MKFSPFLLLLFLFACNVNKPAEFVGIESVRVEEIKNGNVKILAEAKYFNPNLLGGKVKSVDIDVLVDDTVVAQMEEIESFVVPKKEEFIIPLRASINLKDLTKEKGLLGSLANIALGEEIELQFDGNMKLDFNVIDYNYKINETQSLQIK